MTTLPSALSRHPLLARLVATLPGVPGCGSLHLVGGSVRDALLGRVSPDFDVTAERDPTNLARIFARACGGHWFWLDKTRRQSRVVTCAGTCDFAPWRAATLEGDLAARDYTINAMALDLAAPLTLDRLLDPLGGRADLASHTLRMVGPEVLHDDPLRILKGIRHAAELSLQVDPPTLAAMRAAAPLLMQVAAERLRLELCRILAAAEGSRGLELLAEAQVGTELFGADFDQALSPCLAAYRRSRQLFAHLVASAPPLADLLVEPVEQGLDRQTLLLWHECLRQVSPGLPARLAQEWRFSRMATQRLAALAGILPTCWGELSALPDRDRSLVLWCRQHGPDPCDLLLAIALQHEDAHACTTRLIAWLEVLGVTSSRHPLPALLDGDWLRDTFGLEGPQVGAVLDALVRAEIRGEVAGVADARRFASAWVEEKGLTRARAVPIIPPCSRE